MVNNNRIPHDSPELREVLMGFLDSASSLCDMMNTTMAAVLNEVMSIQADEACGAGYGERSDARVNSRNGYRERRLETTVGTLPLLVPKLRSGSYFPTDLFERWSRTDRALAAAVAETCVTGTSTRKVEKVAAKFGVESLTKDQVSRLCAVIDGEVDAFLEKDWSGMSFAYLFLDATYVRCRVGGRVRCEAFITAIGVGDDGHRHFLGFTCANAESYASWRGFLQDLEERGVRGARLVTSDAHNGLRRAISEVYPEATWQRCIVHVKRNVLAKIGGAGAQRRARAAMAPIFKESDPALVRALYHEAVGGARVLRAGRREGARGRRGRRARPPLVPAGAPRQDPRQQRPGEGELRAQAQGEGRPGVPLDGLGHEAPRRHSRRDQRGLGVREAVHVEGVAEAGAGPREGREPRGRVRAGRGGEVAGEGDHEDRP